MKRISLRLLCLVLALTLLSSQLISLAQQKKRETQAEATVTPEEAAQLEAVVTTELGVIRFEFLPNKAPRHAQQFIKLAHAGFYDGSAFHRVIQRGIIQGGDPQLKDPKSPRDKWGT